LKSIQTAIPIHPTKEGKPAVNTTRTIPSARAKAKDYEVVPSVIEEILLFVGPLVVGRGKCGG